MCVTERAIPLLAAVVFCAALVAPASAGSYLVDDSLQPPVIYSPDRKLIAETTPLCPYKRKLDGTWSAHLLGSDGDVYFGSSTHATDESGMFFKYAPQTKAMSVLSADLSEDCGENDLLQVPQGKIHSAPAELNGWVYATTHVANYEAAALASYTGSHVMRWNMATGETQDWGVTRDNYTSYSAITADPINDYVYCWVNRWWGSPGSSIYRWDGDGSNKTHIGDFGPGGSNYYQFVDSQGNMWFNHSMNSGTMYKVAPSGAVNSYAGTMPSGLHEITGEVLPQSGWWHWGAAIDADRCVFTMRNQSNSDLGGGLWEFDAAKARAGDWNGAFRLLNFIGCSGSGKALGGDTVYYLQSANPEWTHGNKASDHHLKSVKIEADAPIRDWGRLIDPDGRTPYRCPAMSADDQGNVYMTGDWRVADGDPNEYSSLRREFGETGEYVDLWRGEFFATVNVPEPTTALLLAVGLIVPGLNRRKRGQK